jgi:hypothetical protein
MHIEKLNPLVQRMAKDLMKARTSLPLSSAVATINYKLANLASQIHVKVDTRSGFPPAPVNVYSIMLLKSGGGKNSSLTLVDKWYLKDAYEKITSTIYPFYKNKALAMLQDAGDERSLHNWSSEFNSGTDSGIMAHAETFYLCKFGSFNIVMDELGNTITSKKDVLEALLSPYDNGDFKPTAKRTDPNALDIKGLPVNLFCLGNKVRLLDGDATEKQFITFLDEGYGRRMFFTDDDRIVSKRTPENVLKEFEASHKISEEAKDLRELFASKITSLNFNKILPLTDKAMLAYATIKSEGDNYVEETKGLYPAVEADMGERHFKTAKLAAIYAFFDGSNVVTEEHINQAFQVTKESSIVLAELRKIKHVHERLLEMLLWEKEPVTIQYMLTNYPFINSNWTKKIQEHIDLAKQLAMREGYEWIEDMKSGVTFYQVIDNNNHLESAF